MDFNYDDKLIASDLELSYKEKLIDVTKERIRINEDLMARIKAYCEEENKDNVDGKLTLKDYIDLKIDEMAEDAVDRIRIYCEFDIKVRETEL